MNQKKLSWEDTWFLIWMGVPALGIALVYSLVTTYLPFFIEKLSSAGAVGLIVGGEGFFALCIPFIIGSWSDAIETPLGRRLPFIFAGTLLTSLFIFLMPFSINSLIILAFELAFFYIGFFTIYAAYYAFFPDLIPMEARGRSQGIQGGFRSLGMLIALVSGGILIHVWEPLPFLLYGLILLLTIVILYFGVRQRIIKINTNKVIDWYGEWKLIKHNKKIRLWVIANTLWETAVGALRVFVVLYFTKGLHMSLSKTSAALGLVGLSAIFAAPIAGYLADRYSHKPVILTAVVCFAIGLFPALLTTNKVYISAILPVAFAAVILMTLPFSILMKLLPQKRHGTGAALFGFCQGLGALIGPLSAGLAVELFRHVDFLVFEKTEGYSAVFLVSSFYLFLSVPFSISLFRSSSQRL